MSENIAPTTRGIQTFLRRQLKTHSAREIAKMAGLSGSTISRLLNGSRNPGMETVRKLLEAFGYQFAISMKKDGE